MRTSLTLKHDLRIKKAELLPYLQQVQKFGELHPLIRKVVELSPGKYEVEEPVIIFNKVLYPNRYTIEIIADDSRIKYIGNVKSIVRIEIDFIVEDKTEGCGLREDIVITGPIGIIHIVKGMIGRIHKQMFMNIGKIK